MRTLARLLVIAIALGASGLLPIATELFELGCCDGEASAEAPLEPDCASCIVSCVCCPARIAPAPDPTLEPAASPAPAGYAVVVTATPVVSDADRGLFQPPRA